MIDALGAQGLTYRPVPSGGCSESTSATEQFQVGPWETSHAVHFSLWVFPSVEALEADWELGTDGVLGEPGVHRLPGEVCSWGPNWQVYRNANILLIIGPRPEAEPLHPLIIDTFLGLTP